jgi:uncharacterized membrane protein YphA (DoxX/SURF4 family)
MNMESVLDRYSTLVLRFGLVTLFLWFGSSQVMNPSEWVSWVPEWVPSLLNIDATTIVMLNGGFEMIGGFLLLLGLFVRWAALLLFLHLLLIAYEVGYNDIGIRDFALALSTLALGLRKSDEWTIESRYK